MSASTIEEVMSEPLKPPLPPFNSETAHQKVKAAQDAWNTRNSQAVKLAYTPDSMWRDRDTFLKGRDEIEAWLAKKWEKENGLRCNSGMNGTTRKASGSGRTGSRTRRLRKRQMSGNDVKITGEERWLSTASMLILWTSVRNIVLENIPRIPTAEYCLLITPSIPQAGLAPSTVHDAANVIIVRINSVLSKQERRRWK
ncbi:hypothetical protein MKZ38_004625 [Zalerion maritima]|uniref:Uncharacterized protein n=1 Tax=Zalerion maritima TaxID=339359 RepID=A0AAD5RLR1_9PEZI|nr:hypothetical protein MKZ38_004625 [Zalerion maritima]